MLFWGQSITRVDFKKEREREQKKWRQYKQSLFSFFVKEYGEMKQQLEGIATSCLHGHGNESIEKKCDTEIRGCDSRITVLYERKGSRFNVQVEGLALAGKFIFFTRRKGKVYDTGGCRMTELKNTRSHFASGTMQLHLPLCPNIYLIWFLFYFSSLFKCKSSLFKCKISVKVHTIRCLKLETPPNTYYPFYILNFFKYLVASNIQRIFL